jgi:hypothetical protein
MIINNVSGFRIIQRKTDGASYLNHYGLSVIISEAQEDDGNIWIHVSLARKSSMPTYDDLKLVYLGMQVQILSAP